MHEMDLYVTFKLIATGSNLLTEVIAVFSISLWGSRSCVQFIPVCFPGVGQFPHRGNIPV